LLDSWVPFWQSVWRRRHRAADSYYCLAANPDAVRARLADAAARVRIRLGYTLSAGAGFYGTYLRDDLTHAYLLGPQERVVEAAELEPMGRGGNVVLYPEPDEGLLYLPRALRGRLGLEPDTPAAAVSPVQLYLDLKAAGGRLAEQADRLREEVLGDEL
jgi:hypothetical protein